MKHERGVRLEPQSSAIPTPRFNQRVATLDPTCHTEISDLANASRKNSRTQWDFKAGKPISRLKYVQNQQIFISQSTGTKKVEISMSTDDLMTSRPSTGRKDFTDYDMFDAMMASVLKKLLTHVHFRKRVSVEEQGAQKYDRFLRGKQVAYMIYEHFRATEAYEAGQGPSDLFNLRLQNDDVQDFDTRWDQAPLAASEIPTEMVLEG